MTTEPNIHLGDENNEIDAQEMSTTDEGESTPRASATHLQVKNEEINDQLAQVAASSPTDSPFVASIEKRSRHLPAAAPSDQDGKVEAQMSDAEDCQSNHSDRYDAQIKRDTLTYIDIPQTFSFVHQPPSSTTYRFDLKDASTISSHQLDEEIRTTLLDGRTTRSAAMVEATATSTFATLVTRRSAAAAATNVSAIRVIKTLALTSATGSRKVPSLQQRAAILEAGRENRRAERDRRRALVARHRAVTGGSSPTSSASSSPSTEKMRCLRCLTLETPQWRYIHKGRYCNACYMRVKRWVENNRPGRKLPSRVKNPLSADEDARLQKDADDLVSQAFEALERQGI